jgi:hypothetical protein
MLKANQEVGEIDFDTLNTRIEEEKAKKKWGSLGLLSW